MENKRKIGPFLKDKNSTSKMMFHLFVALLPIILFSFYKNGYLPYQEGKATLIGLFYPLLFIFIPTMTSFLTELLWMRFFLHKKGKNLKISLIHSFSIFPGLFLGLILPINTPISILIFGAIFATIIGKMIYGGFGNNIFNPALIGRLFIISTYALTITNNGGYLNPSELDAITTATPLSNVSLQEGIGTYKTLVSPYGNLWNFFFGTIPGAVGETSALFCLLGFIYLVFKKVIKPMIPITYIGTVFFITFLIGSFNDLGIWYPLFQILSGGLFFGACFMATDPVTSPTTPIGQTLYGLFLGILTVIFRYLTPYPEGVLTSILTMNLFVYIIDRIGSKARFHKEKAILPFILAIFLIFYTGCSIGTSYQKETTTKDTNFEIVSKEGSGNTVTYVVTQKGYVGKIKAQIKIENGTVTSYEVLEQNESFFGKVEDANYINRLLQNQLALKDVDTVSGATITSTALKKLFINTLEDYKENGGTLSGNIVVPPTTTTNFEILEKEKTEESTIYIVSQKGFSGKIKLQIVFQNDAITSIDVLEVKDSYFYKIEDNDYLNTLLFNQNTLEELDTITGATVSSKALKNALMETIKDYEEESYEE